MTILKILKFPDERLTTSTDDWNFNRKDIDVLINHARDMKETLMNTDNGLALAANQVGIPYNIICFNKVALKNEFLPQFAINPYIRKSSNFMRKASEGCLSLPGIFRDIERHCTVSVVWYDFEGKRYVKKFKRLEAVCWQHEIDHLRGIDFEELFKRSRENIITI